MAMAGGERSADDAPKRVTGVTGRVSRGPFGTGSKSEHDAVWIDTGAARYVLRRKGGPAMGDPALERYLGCTVRCDGVLLSHTLVANAIEVVG
ncbi:MAG: hypothetical protein IT519_08060 [Burkholderiales bacterium]|nr:hypothetical protein [Burkholderiales bacterium]